MELGQTSWKNLFRFVCVDPSPSRPSLPGWLKKVPTIVLAGEPEPRTDSDVMNWLYEKKMKEGGGNKGGQQAPPPGMGGEPDAFNMMEQASFAKGFSYSGLDTDTSTAGDGGASMPGSFAFLNGGASFGNRTEGNNAAPSGNSGRGKTKKEEMFDKQMEAYQREREAGVPRSAPRM